MSKDHQVLLGLQQRKAFQIPFVGDLCGEFTGFNRAFPLYFFLPFSIVLTYCSARLVSLYFTHGKQQSAFKGTFSLEALFIREISCPLHEKKPEMPTVLSDSRRYRRLKSNSYAHHMKSQYFGKGTGSAS